MAKFAGVVLEKLNQPLRLVQGIEVPRLGRGQVLVEMAFSGVCHSQVMEADGARGEDKFLPHLLGHEGTGYVRETGEGVTKVRAGDRVILGWIKGEGLDGGGCKYASPIGTINSGGVTTFSEWTVASENRLVKLPAGIPMDEGVLFGCALPTGAGLVLNEIKPADGSTLAVWGLGGIGLSALMAAQAYRCAKVIAIDLEESKLDMARDFGATHTVHAGREDVARAVAAITGERGLDYCVESAGRVETIEAA